jgi:mevalonate pyrophosphate decarboxylase
VLLELAAMGQDTSAASLAVISVAVSGRGKSEAAARAQHDAILNRVREAARIGSGSRGR